jgi:uncharacterized alpha-E superfamily protein
MLGRSANGIFWMSRYLERAENTARLLDAGFHLALTRGQNAARDEWRSVLVSIGQEQAYWNYHTEISGPQVTNFILRSPDNPGSVLAMIDSARNNARSVRTGITREVWEATNESWMTLHALLAHPVKATNLGEVLAAIRRQATQVRGAMSGTMLRNEIFNFARIGTFIERADNTVRILDVKYHLLLPSIGWVGSTLDNAQWETVLRSLAGERAYRWLNAGSLDPRGIAEFLILDGRFPGSLAYCFSKLRSNMNLLTGEYGCELPSHELLRSTGSRLTDTSIAGIFEFGLHEFLISAVVGIKEVADSIATDYRFTA